MNFEQWLASKGFTLAGMSDQQKQYLQAQFDDQVDPEPDPEPPATTVAAGAVITVDDPLLVQRNQLADDRLRVANFSRIEATYASQIPADAMHTLTATAIRDNWTAEKFELELIRKRRPTSGVGGNGFTPKNRFKLTAAVVTAALSLSAGIAESAVGLQIPAAEREQVMNDATSGDMRGYSLHALMDHVIHEAGGHYGGSRKSNAYIRATLAAERQLRQAHALEADGFSTLSLSGILSNVANKGLNASYSAVEVAWPKICAVRNHSDFKVHTRYRLDSTGAFRKVAADGELKSVGLDNASFTNQLGTFGAIITLTRQMMINDDLGAFMEIPNLLGRMAALRLEEAVFVLLLSNPSSFFAAGNNNYMSGASSALAVSSLATAEKKFMNQIDSNGKPILISPKTLLVGTTLKADAQNIFDEKVIIASSLGSTSGKVVEPAKNKMYNKYPPVASPYLDNTAITDQDGNAITGQSSTLWVLLADPAVRAAIAVAFLNGQMTPTIESSQTEFDTLGMQWRAFHDFGVGMEDPAAAVESAGA